LDFVEGHPFASFKQVNNFSFFTVQSEGRTIGRIGCFLTGCFGRITFKVIYWEEDTSNSLAIESFDSSTNSKKTTGLLVFKKDGMVLLNTPKNQKDLDTLNSFLSQHGLQDHMTKYSKSNAGTLKFRTSALNLDLEEYFFFSGYTLNAYNRTEKQSPSWEIKHFYFFSKD